MADITLTDNDIDGTPTRPFGVNPAPIQKLANIGSSNWTPPPTDTAAPQLLNYESMVRAAAKAHGLDPDIIAHQASQESGFDNRALSTAGAQGIMQLMPATAKRLGVDPANPAQNIQGGVAEMQRLYNKYNSYDKALAAYHAGEGAVDSGKPLGPKTQDYVRKILGGAATNNDVTLTDADIDKPKEMIQYGNLPATDETLAGKLKGGLQTLIHNPNLIPGPLSAVAEAGKQLYQRATGELNPDGSPAYPLDFKEAADRIRNQFISGAAMEGPAIAMEAIGSPLANILYRKNLGIKSGMAAEASAVADMVEHHIPIGLGQQRGIDRWKAPENAALNALYDKYASYETPANITDISSKPPRVVNTVQKLLEPGNQLATRQPPPPVEGTNAQPSSTLNYATLTHNTLRKSDLKAALDDYYSADAAKTIPQKEKIAATAAFKNFFADMPENMDINDLRQVKGHIQAKVPYNERTEGDAQARKILDRLMTDRIAGMMSPEDGTAFQQHSNELRKAINAEDILEKSARQRRDLFGPYMTRHVVSGMLGNTLYTHGAGLPTAVAGGAAMDVLANPNSYTHAINLARSPWAQRAAGYAMQQGTPAILPGGQQRFEDLPPAVQNAMQYLTPGNLFGRTTPNANQ